MSHSNDSFHEAFHRGKRFRWGFVLEIPQENDRVRSQSRLPRLSVNTNDEQWGQLIGDCVLPENFERLPILAGKPCDGKRGRRGLRFMGG